MIVLLCLAAAAVLVGLAALAVRYKRRRDTPEELRGDWWAHFEAEFRAYAGGRERNPRTRRRAQRRDVAEGA